MPLCTTVNSCKGSLVCGWEFLASGGPWVAQRVCAMPLWLSKISFSATSSSFSWRLACASRASMLPADLMMTALLSPGFWKLRCCKAWRFLAASPALSSRFTESYLELCIGATAEAAVVEDLSMQIPALSYL